MTKEEAIKTLQEDYCGERFFCELHQDGLCSTEDCEIWWAIKALETQSDGDTISRQAAKHELYKMLHDCFWADDEEQDAVAVTLDNLPSAQPEHTMRFADDDHVWIDGKQYISLRRFHEAVIEAQPETHEKRTETHERDLISRKDAIRIVDSIDTWQAGWRGNAIESLKAMPSAQPEIIRCRDCKYAEVADAEDTQDGYTCQFHRGSIWFSGGYCSWAERRTDG